MGFLAHLAERDEKTEYNRRVSHRKDDKLDLDLQHPEESSENMSKICHIR